MSKTHAVDFVERIMSDDEYRKEVIAKLPENVTYKAGNEDELIGEIAKTAGKKGYRMTKEELQEAVDAKISELGVFKTTKWALKLKKELDNR